MNKCLLKDYSEKPIIEDTTTRKGKNRNQKSDLRGSIPGNVFYFSKSRVNA